MGSVSPATQRFVERLLALAPGTQNGGIVPGDPNQGGYHNSRNKLYALGKTNDYSVRLAADKRGNGDRFCGIDWTFPEAQRGDFSRIRFYGNRVRDAWNRRDPRLAGWREVLIRSDDGIAGYDFQPFSFRTPDSSHGWHGHFSVLRENVDTPAVYDNMISILAGESLASWQQRVNGAPDVDLNDTVPRTATEDHPDRTVAQIFMDLWRDVHLEIKPDLGALRSRVDAPTPVQVDASAVAAALAQNTGFLNAVAAAVGAEVARRMAS